MHSTPSHSPRLAVSSSRGIGGALARAIQWALIVLIYAYRALLGPLLGGACRFEPSCSHYAEAALRKHGPLKGAALALRRLAKCHPWGPFGPDPVP
ncbi:MAG TPA: membrane protein insertion efficiency factor YidD [candidate division Zixibacteria bacterium]|nr:membrane protein insertion efficiency factor YidD [candidate division Zixibacteria bacterium]